MKPAKPKTCKCGNEFKPKSALSKWCSYKCWLKAAKETKRSITVKVLVKGSPIRKVSKKRAVENREYLKLRAKFLAENPRCAVYPELMATDVHHMASGKDRAKHYLDVDTWMSVSRAAHNWIHENPREARQLGYLK